MSTYEMATLIAAARWALEGGQGELVQDARNQLAQVLRNYDNAAAGLEE